MYQHHNCVGSHHSIPPQAFLFEPQSLNSDALLSEITNYKELKDDDFMMVRDKDNLRRLLYEGSTKYTCIEYKKLKEFEQYLDRKKITIDSRWSTCWRLRWLHSVNFDYKQCVKDMEAYIIYRDQRIQRVMNSRVETNLAKGIFYMAGRDAKYRPILVFEVKKMISSKLTEEEIIECEIYFFEYILRNMLIPGKVENWNTLVDISNEGVMSMAGTMKSSLTFLQSTYRSRMYVCYVVRPSSACSFLWSIAQKLLTEDTKKKIKFVEGDIVNQLLDYCNPSQLEQKFGGKCPNFTQGNFWPPKNISSNFETQTCPVNKMSKVQYRENYKKGSLQHTKIYEPYIQESIKRHNANLQNLIRIEKELQPKIEECKAKQISTTELSDLNNESRQLRPSENYNPGSFWN